MESVNTICYEKKLSKKTSKERNGDVETDALKDSWSSSETNIKKLTR